MCLTVVVWRVGDGWDQTDEAFYLQAAASPRPDDAFNGLWNLYLRPLWRLTHWNVAAMRLLGLAALVAAAIVLGRATAALAGRRASLVTAVAVAAATGFYASGLRSPSYNLLAMVGAMLACAAMLRLLDGAGDAWGAVAGLGTVVAGIGKATTGALLALLVAAVAVALRRGRATLLAALALAVAVAVHAVLVLPLPRTLEVLRRSSAFLAVFDPGHYTPSGVVLVTVTGGLVVAVAALQAGALYGLLPLAAVPGDPGRPVWVTRLTVAAVVLASAAALATRAWFGGYREAYTTGPGMAAVLGAVAGNAATTRAMGLRAAPAGRQVAGCLLLVAAAVACLVGSNVSFGFLSQTTGPLVAPACLLAARALPVDAVRPVSGALAACLCAGSVVVAVEAHGEPKRGAPLAVSTVPIAQGPAIAYVDAATAAEVGQLVTAAHAAGWRAGMPLVDTSYLPVVPLALDADVPPVLLPRLPLEPAAPVCRAVAGLGPRWTSAWLLVPVRERPGDLAATAAYVGHAPADYVRVTTFDDPYLPIEVELLAPRAPGDAARAGSCLTDTSPTR